MIYRGIHCVRANICATICEYIYLYMFIYIGRYDNVSSTYKAYTVGPEVDAQLEVSFQANLHFPASIGHHFGNVNFTALKKAVAADSGEYSRRRRKQFLLRFRIAATGNGVHREVVSVEQITVHSTRPYSEFPRVVRRIRDTAEEYFGSDQSADGGDEDDLEF